MLLDVVDVVFLVGEYVFIESTVLMKFASDNNIATVVVFVIR